MHDFATPLPQFISGLALRYGITKEVGAIFAAEQPINGVFHGPHWLDERDCWSVNSGVYLVRVSKQAEALFAAWRDDALEVPAWWRRTDGCHPQDQQTLTRLIVRAFQKGNAKDLSPGSSAAVVNMTEMNSPWGRFAKHMWSGPGVDLQQEEYTAALRRARVADPAVFTRLLDAARRSIQHWPPAGWSHSPTWQQLR